MTNTPEKIASRLLDAMRHARPISSSEIMQQVPTSDEGYLVQTLRNRRWEATGATGRGWKIGLTSPAAQQAFGAHEPMRGLLFADTQLPPIAEVELSAMCAPKLEGEIALKVKQCPGPNPSDAELQDSLLSVHAAFEIADSRIEGWRIAAPQAIADNACCGRFGIVEPGFPLGQVDLKKVPMSISDTVTGDVLSDGIGTNCLGSPLEAYRWLVGKLKPGDLRPGDIILTGALGPMVPLAVDRHYRINVGELGFLNVSVTK